MTKYDDKDWFRSSQWNEAIEAEFERRLKRARSTSRAQYIRIQAVHLADQADPELRAVARRLYQRVMGEYGDTDKMQATAASEELAESWQKDGFLGEAESAYRTTLALIGERPTGRNLTTHLTELLLAEVLYVKGDEESLREASLLLDVAESQAKSSIFNISKFRFLLARARVAAALGEPRAADFARNALEVGQLSEPTLSRHPDLDLPKPQSDEREELTSIESRFARAAD